MIPAPCPDCGATHTSTDTCAVGRFLPTGPEFRARYDGAPLRATRAEAERDMCRWRQDRRPLDRQEPLL